MSTRIPDFAILSQAEGVGVKQTVMVVEMAFSQSYQSLRQDVKE